MITLYTYKGKLFDEDSTIHEKFVEYDWNDLDYLVWSGIVKKIATPCKIECDFSNELFSSICNVSDTSYNVKFDVEKFSNYDNIRFRYNQDFGVSLIPRSIFLGNV